MTEHDTRAVTTEFALGTEKDGGIGSTRTRCFSIRGLRFGVVPARSGHEHPEKRKFHADLLTRFGGRAITEQIN